MRQLVLDLGAAKPRTLANFIVGQNRELLQLLQAYQPPPRAPREPFIYLWGEGGAGKSHLLHALAGERSRYVPAGCGEDAYRYRDDTHLYLVDDCQRLAPAEQVAVFALFNQIRENGGCMISAGDSAPAGLALREDLRTRLGWGLVYQVHGLSDDEKIAALTQAAEARGISLSPGVLPYLITHFRRDMPSLTAMLDALDKYSLETQRPITLPLLRSLLQLEGEPKPQ
ncbi:MAG TPA: DnaA regulatory inactivator Hda [Noviherbaspirillum sp.]|jgi:DnaA family protein|uniref:DnaA regulatory inactivator Hda n=1 Tax=Noviherbaspirillum sp. TaxID=1926288 RepID=UPI002F951179